MWSIHRLELIQFSGDSFNPAYLNIEKVVLISVNNTVFKLKLKPFKLRGAYYDLGEIFSLALLWFAPIGPIICLQNVEVIIMNRAHNAQYFTYTRSAIYYFCAFAHTVTSLISFIYLLLFAFIVDNNFFYKPEDELNSFRL